MLLAFFTSVALASVSSAGTIWIQWDPSSDPAVIGYRVSVGTSPGNYTETFDVGSRTVFAYDARESRVYYLAVASYAAGPRFGPLSAPVSAAPIPGAGEVVSSNVTDVRSFYGSLWRPVEPAPGVSSRDSARRVFRSVEATSAAAHACWEPSTECAAVRTVARRNARITSLAPVPDGRLLFIEDGQRIMEMSPDMRQLRMVLAADGDVRLNQVGVDPRFAEPGFMYVGESESRTDGSREFRLVRYRLVDDGTAPEVLVRTALPFSGDDAAFALGSSGHLYVAVPEGENGDAQHTASAGVILRLNIDGTIPDEQHDSLVFATGYPKPTAVSFDDRTLRLWVAGLDDRNDPSISSLGERTSALSLPATSLATASADGSDYLFVVSSAGGLGRARVEPNGVLTSN